MFLIQQNHSGRYFKFQENVLQSIHPCPEYKQEKSHQ